MRKHSFLSAKCEARSDSEIHRRGVFAKDFIKRGELIAIWGGYVMTLEEYEKVSLEIRRYDYPVQVYDGFYLGPKEAEDLDDAEYFNHSCEPNAGVKGQNILVARRDIKKGEEICFDYETTDTQGLNFNCACGAKICRGKIDGSSWQNQKFREKNRGYFSLYIQEKIKEKYGDN
jgi:uncharacterized protein